MLHEDEIVNTLIDEDEKRSTEPNLRTNSDIGGWLDHIHVKIVKKLKNKANQEKIAWLGQKQVKFVKKLKKKPTISPFFNSEHISSSTKDIKPTLSLPKVVNSSTGTGIFLAHKAEDVFKKANSTQPPLELTGIRLIKNTKLAPSEQIRYTRGSSTVNHIALKTIKQNRDNISLVSEIKDSSCLFVPSNKQIRKKKGESVGYYSAVYEKYFPKCSPITSLLGQPEFKSKSILKKSKSKNLVGEILSSELDSDIGNKKLPNEGRRIVKKFLLSPIYQNICKYNSVFYS